ncbi:MAG: glycosyltransferase family 39 protein [Bryobacteraceae bacterium]|nr:glycosyltransferase family 39 protein [Bryobacteraceae bacterium]
MHLRLLLAFVIVTRLPFLWQPIQGDDLYYLYGAQHAQIDPAHPHQAKYFFQGREVSMLGHPHPPLNAWILGGLLAARGDIDEVLFHGVYLLFSLICAAAMYALARKFAPGRELLASLLFLSTPVLWVSGTSLESDLPFLALWMSGLALWVHGRVWPAVVPLLLSGLAAYQAVALIPVLWLARRSWLAIAPAVGVVAYQVFEYLSAGVFPILATAGYFSEYGLQRWQAKLLNAAALTAHLPWLSGPVAMFQPSWWLALGLPTALVDWHPLFWLSFAIGLVVLVKIDGFLGWWVRIFFAAALILFFAGSARYLLPIAPALALWAAAKLSEERLTYAVAAQMMLAGLLALTNYQHWQTYKDFALANVVPDRRVWVDGEWGFRYYAESRGAVALPQGRRMQDGDRLLEQELAHGNRSSNLPVLAQREIRPSLPLCLIGTNCRSGWSSVAFGLRPFDVSFAPLDTVRLRAVAERAPTVSFLQMNAPECEYQLLGGFFSLEENRYRWMAPRGEVALVGKGGPLTIEIYATEERALTVSANGRALGTYNLKMGLQTIATPPVDAADRVIVTLTIDRPVKAPGDSRELGAIVQSIGFQ